LRIVSFFGREVLRSPSRNWQYPWDAADLKQKLKNRYIDFKENPKYHALKKKVAANPQYMNTRYLDPGNPKSSRKDFYNPNILREFDKNYTLKK
jgi:hypothetical protein